VPPASARQTATLTPFQAKTNVPPARFASRGGTILHGPDKIRTCDLVRIRDAL
jgi:hypothetical protein